MDTPTKGKSLFVSLTSGIREIEMPSVNKYDALILDYLDGSCTSEDIQVLLSWLAESEENRLYFESFKRIWEMTGFDRSGKLDVEWALANVSGRIDAFEAEKQEEA